MKAPVVVFAYKRAECLDGLLTSLEKAERASDTEIYIYADAAKSSEDEIGVRSVERIIEKHGKNNRFQSYNVVWRDRNYGLAENIIQGVTDVINQYGRVIVLEDDLVVSEDFLLYMNDCLDCYNTDDKVGAIGAFGPYLTKMSKCESGIYKAHIGCSYGWGTWKRCWDKVEWSIEHYKKLCEDKSFMKRFESYQYGISAILEGYVEGTVSSWAVRWDAALAEDYMYTIYPCVSKVQNNGFDIDATNTRSVIDKRKKIECKRADYDCSLSEELVDMTFLVRKSYIPSIFERMIYHIIKYKKRKPQYYGK